MHPTRPSPPDVLSTRRRPWRAAFLCLAAVTAVGAALLSPGCAEAPIALKYTVRSSLDAARSAGAATHAAGWLESADEAFSQAQKELARQLGRSRWRRDYARAEAWLETAGRRARLAETRSREISTEARRLADSLIGRARSGFRQMAWASSYIPPRSAIRSDVSRARVSFDEATARFAEGRYDRAVTAARSANDGLEMAYGRFARLIAQHTDPSRANQYDRWVRETIAWSAANRSPAIIVDKARRTLTWVSAGRRVKSYRAELGLNGTQSKTISGDRATPEGRYRITEKRGPRQTRWYKALLLNYPNEEDLARFNQMRRRGQISGRARPGSLIEIHGEGGRGGDWTEGCVALGNRDIDDLFDRVSVGTPVTIVGFETHPAVAAEASTRRAASSGSSRARRTGVAGGL